MFRETLPFLIAACSLLAVASPLAQAQQREAGIRVEFTAMAYNAQKSPVWYLPSQGDLPREIKTNLFTRSTPYPYRGPAVLNLFAEKPDPTAKTPPVPVGTITFQQGMKRPMVLLYQAPNGRVQSLVFEDDPQSFPSGSYRLMNLTEHTVAIRIGEVDSTLRPQGTDTKPFPVVDQDLEMLFAMQRSDRWRQLSKDKVKFEANTRVLMLVAPNLASPGSPPSLRVVREAMAPPPPPPGQRRPAR